MAARIYTDSKVGSRALKGKVCAVIGFGSQGRAQALNLRDSGVDVIIGLYRGSRSWPVARKCGFKVLPTADAVRCADVVFWLLPDTKMPEVFERDIKPSLRKGQTLLVAHGFAIVYRTVVPPRNIDVIMVAPKGLGPMVRREYLAGRGVPALVAVHQDFTGDARDIAFGWAKGIGSGRARNYRNDISRRDRDRSLRRAGGALWRDSEPDSGGFRDTCRCRLRAGARLLRMSARIEIHRRPDSRAGIGWNAPLDFRYRPLGRAYGRAADYR